MSRCQIPQPHRAARIRFARPAACLLIGLLTVMATPIFSAPLTSADVLESERLRANRSGAEPFLSGDLQGRGEEDGPARAAASARTDTIDFGFYEVRQDGLTYAVRGERWTWDHGAADPLEGWVSVDRTVNAKEFWRWMSPAQWVVEGNPESPEHPAPDMGAGGYVLCGTTQGYADSLGWVARLGYGNNWCQRLTSPTLVYDGTGAVNLQFRYFNYTDTSYDYSKLYLETSLVRRLLNPPGFHGTIGITADQGSILPALYTRTLANSDFGGGTEPRDFTITLEFDSDGRLSDEDGANSWDAAYGAWGVDDVQVDGSLVPPTTVSYTFNNDLQGWTASRCPGAGSYMGVAPLSQYVLDDPCDCFLFGNVLEFHDANFEHPDDGDPVPQEEAGITPIVDRKTDIGDPQYLDYNQILVRWDQYDLMPKNSGVHFRPGYTYYPYTPPNVPGFVTWSPRVGQTGWFYTGDIGNCALIGQTATANGVPADCERMRFVYEVISSCAAFGVPNCSDVTNFTPIIDNVRVRNVAVANAPAISFETGGRFHDQWGADQIGILSPNDPAYANCSFDTRFGNETAPAKQGDSLGVCGPFPGSATRWEAKLWLRVKRTGPGQAGNATYNTWKSAFIAAKGIPFAPPQSLFTWGYMDSTEIANGPQKNRYCSQFRENDAMFNWGGGGEQGEGNEIVPDLALTPGTKVDYFITSNYTCLPTTYFYLPDTAGKFYSELEILPSFRMDGGVPKFPCVLYVDAFNAGAQEFIERSLNVVLNGAVYGDPIPDPTTWDRYDYFDVASNYKAPMYREDGGNSGATIMHLLGYRAILINTGTYEGATWPRDWQGIQQWLTTPLCDGNQNPQALIADGTSASYIIRSYYPSLLTLAGATHRCESYNLRNCPTTEPDNDENNCVRINPVPGTPFGPGIPTDIFANWCPTQQAYAVLGTTGTGVGNKYFTNAASGTNTEFAQVINNQLAGPFRFRTVIEDWSYHLLTARSGDDPTLECPTDTASRVNAAFHEIRNSLKWLFNVAPGDPLNIGLCDEPSCGCCEVPTESGGGAWVNRLDPNLPNPFNPRTTIRYSLAAEGKATLVVYDVGGRRIRTLVDGPQTAGPHEVVWDGTDDAGRRVPSGVYWTRLELRGFRSNRRLVVLR